MSWDWYAPLSEAVLSCFLPGEEWTGSQVQELLAPLPDSSWLQRAYFWAWVAPRVYQACRDLVADGVLEERAQPGAPERGYRARYLYRLAWRPAQ